MTRQDGPRIDTAYFWQGQPTNRTFAETMDRYDASIPLSLTSGVETTAAVVLQAGDIATNVTFATTATGATTPTAGYVCLRDSTGALITQSADFGSTARAAHTAYTVALTAPYTVPDAGLYYVGISFTAATAPDLIASKYSDAAGVLYGNLGIGAAVLTQTHGSGVGGVAPATIVTPTVPTRMLYLVVT